MPPKIVFLDRATIQAQIRAPGLPHAWQEHQSTDPAKTVERLNHASIAITNKVQLFAAELRQLPELEMIAVAATGTNNVDLDYCKAHGITVCNIRGYATESVPEHVFALALALRRNLPAYREDVRRGLWQQARQFCLFTHPIRDIAGSTFGVIGHGVLGQKVAAIARAFGANVLISEHRGAPICRDGRTPFDTVLEQSDIISLHCPLTPETRGLIGERELGKMRPDALLINTARGGLVDEAALAEAILHSRIGGAGLDVLEKEPPNSGSPLAEIDSPNFILTPHVAWASVGAMQKLADQLIDNIDAFMRGTPQNRVA